MWASIKLRWKLVQVSIFTFPALLNFKIYSTLLNTCMYLNYLLSCPELGIWHQSKFEEESLRFVSDFKSEQQINGYNINIYLQ